MVTEYQFKLCKYFSTLMLFFSIAFAFFFPKDWAGWLLLGGMFFVPFFIKEARENIKLLAVFLVILFAHDAVSIVNNYFYIFPGADSDSFRFYHTALAIMKQHDFKFAFDNKLYEQMLAIFYMVNPSLFFGQELSVLMFLFASFVYVKLVAKVSQPSFRALSLLLFGLLPSNLIWASVTLREAWQLFFIILTFYSVICLRLEHQKRLTNFFIALIAMLAASMTHIVLFLIMPVTFLGLVFCPLGKGSLSFSKKDLIIIITVLSVLLMFFLTIAYFRIELQQLMGPLSNIKSYIWNYRVEHPIAHTSYNITFNLDSNWGYYKAVTKAFFYYLFSPFPWSIPNRLYFIIMLYVDFMLVLFIASVSALVNKKQLIRRIGLLLFLYYFISSFVWSLAVTNYGTALRHRMLTDWILILFGLPYLMKLLLIIRDRFRSLNFSEC